MKSTISPFKQILSQNDFLPSLTIGLSFGVISILTPAIPMAVMLFGDRLPGDYLVLGIKSILLSSIIVGLVIGLGSSVKGMLGAIVLSPILATIVVEAVQALPEDATHSEIFFTILALLGVASALRGIIFFAAGKFNLAEFTSFVPQPIMTGFITGIGLLFLRSSIRIGTNIHLNFSELNLFLEPQILLKLLSTVIFGVVLWLVLKVYKHFLTIPLFILGGIGLFYLALFSINMPISQAFQGDWLLGPFPKADSTLSLNFSGLQRIHWLVVVHKIPEIIAFMVISVFTFAIGMGGFAKISKQDIDLNRELKLTGIANFLKFLLVEPLRGFPLTLLQYRAWVLKTA